MILAVLLVNLYFPIVIRISLKTVISTHVSGHRAAEGIENLCPALLTTEVRKKHGVAGRKANRPNQSRKDSRGTWNEHRHRELAVD